MVVVPASACVAGGGEEHSKCLYVAERLHGRASSVRTEAKKDAVLYEIVWCVGTPSG